jgi:hypothetical protein
MSNVTPSIDSSQISAVPSRSGFSVDITSSNAKGHVVVGNSNEGRGVGRPVALGLGKPETRNSEGRGNEEKGTGSSAELAAVWITMGADSLLGFFQLRVALSDEVDCGPLVAFGGDGGGECRNEDLGLERIGSSWVLSLL